MEKLILQALKAHGVAESKESNILIYVKSRIIIENESDYQFRDDLGICYQDSDGYVITDNDGNNYSITSLKEHFKSKNYISVDEIKSHGI